MAMVGANRTRLRPSGNGDSSTMGPFDTASRSPATSRVIANDDLYSGSSQHGNARRASVASNCVVARVGVVPSAPMNELR